jgi:uncharacterized protein with PhoU and TrkA domain
MADHAKNNEEQENVEDLLYETRFLLNVLIDVLVSKKVFTEDELYKKYDEVLEKMDDGADQK